MLDNHFSDVFRPLLLDCNLVHYVNAHYGTKGLDKVSKRGKVNEVLPFPSISLSRYGTNKWNTYFQSGTEGSN